MLTAQQKADTRRWLGYPTLKNGETDYVFGHTPSSISLSAALDGLSAEELSILTTTYLTNLATLETAILNSQDNMDTAEAGPWKANPREVAERRSLFAGWRRDMADFLGFAPGPGLAGGSNTMQIVRA